MYFNDVCATYLATIWSHWEGEDVKVAASSGILETGVVNEGVPGVRILRCIVFRFSCGLQVLVVVIWEAVAAHVYTRISIFAAASSFSC
jgi:hypothetical protein